MVINTYFELNALHSPYNYTACTIQAYWYLLCESFWFYCTILATTDQLFSSFLLRSLFKPTDNLSDFIVHVQLNPVLQHLLHGPVSFHCTCPAAAVLLHLLHGPVYFLCTCPAEACLITFTCLISLYMSSWSRSTARASSLVYRSLACSKSVRSDS